MLSALPFELPPPSRIARISHARDGVAHAPRSQAHRAPRTEVGREGCGPPMEDPALAGAPTHNKNRLYGILQTDGLRSVYIQMMLMNAIVLPEHLHTTIRPCCYAEGTDKDRMSSIKHL